MDRKDKSNLVAQLQAHKGFQVLLEDWKVIFEALKNELENPDNPHVQYTQGQVATYRNIFNYINELTKDAIRNER